MSRSSQKTSKHASCVVALHRLKPRTGRTPKASQPTDLLRISQCVIHNQIMAKATNAGELTRDRPAEPKPIPRTPKRTVCDSGRMLLAVIEINPHWEFHGTDIELRSVRFTALNLAYRSLSGILETKGESYRLQDTKRRRKPG